ncbi:MAG TPA: ABC transporter ATP-binding protein [Solirubrobacteraceae bacterium]
MTEPLLKAEGISAGYDETTVLEDVGLHIEPGEMVALVGRNGVGKTTLVRVISGLLPAKAGRIELDSAPIDHWPIHRRARAGLRVVTEDRGLFANLTVGENLEVAARHAASGRRLALEDVVERFPRLAERRGQRAGSLSGGEQRMLALARAFVSGPRVLIVDEFSEGLQPSITQELASALARAHADGLSVLLVEQNVHLALKLAGRAYILEKGRIVHEAEAAELSADLSALSRYLVI